MALTSVPLADAVAVARRVLSSSYQDYLDQSQAVRRCTQDVLLSSLVQSARMYYLVR